MSNPAMETVHEEAARRREMRLLARLIAEEEKLKKCRGVMRDIKRFYAKAEQSYARELVTSCLKEVFGE